MLDVLQSDFVGMVLSISESNMSVIVKLMHNAPRLINPPHPCMVYFLHLPQKINQKKCK